MSNEAARLRVKTWICAAFLKKGMPAELPTPLSDITVLFQLWVALGVVLFILWLTSRMTLLSWADLSCLLPVTSIGYVLVALAGRLFLAEQIPVKRWAGIGLIVAGVALVSLGIAPRTHQPEAGR